MDTESIRIRINSALEFKDWEICNQYKRVSALALYWQEGDDVGFKREVHEIGQLFSQDFHFDVEYYAIPSEQSYVNLDTRINLLLSSRGSRDDLVIIYYSGHGDANDEDGEEELSVWAALKKDGPTVKWSTIQAKFGEVQAEFLLLLDCCYAAQAVRARQNRAISANMELLTACAMRNKTVLPGPDSFTTHVIKAFKRSLGQNGSVTISGIANLLASRDSGYNRTPVHFSGLRGGKSTISLEPFVMTTTDQRHFEHERAWMTLRVSLRDILTEPMITDIIGWLKDRPRTKVSRLTVENVVSSVSTMQTFIHDYSRSYGAPKFEQLSASAQQDVLAQWTRLQSLLAVLATQLRSKSLLQGGTSDGSKALANKSGSDSVTTSNTLLEIEKNISSLQAIVHRSVMALPDLYTSNESLTEAIEDTTMQDMGFLPLLSRRLKARFALDLDPSMKMIHEDNNAINPRSQPPGLVEETIGGLGNVLVEYKYYTESSKPKQTERQVMILANLLQIGTPDFQTLRCLRWFHEPELRRFGLIFEYPQGCDGFKSLHDAIISTGQSKRPSLGQRFSIVKDVGDVMQKWHASANWVHQGISSRNIYFFKTSDSAEFSYERPYVCGFEFSRPSKGISTNAYVEDFDQNVYRHPARQGEPSEYHNKKHDIYSFGVLLFEVGMWLTVKNIFTEKLRVNLSPNKMREYIRMNAARRLGQAMGLSYERATLRCLDTNFGVQLDDEVESMLAKAFQELVLDEIDRGTTLD